MLDAADDLLRERPWAEVTMADVAAAAGVSRQTLYNEFGSRDDLAQAYVLREVERFLGAVERAVTAHRDDPAAALSAAFNVFLDAAADHPVLRAGIAGHGHDGLIPYITTHGGPVIELAVQRLAAVICDGWPVVKPADARLLAEAVVRLAISYAALPAGPASMTAASVTTLLGPYLERLLRN